MNRNPLRLIPIVVAASLAALVGCAKKALDAPSSPCWNLPLGEMFWQGSHPALGADGTIYVVSADSGYLYAVNPDGTLKWRTHVGYGMTSPAISADGTIYISAGNALSALSPDGNIKWSRPAGMQGICATFGNDGVILVADTFGYLGAFNDSGNEVWSYPTWGQFWSPAAVGADGSIYFLSMGGGAGDVLLALDAGGHFRWCDSIPMAGFENVTLAIGADGTLYFGDENCVLWAVAPDGHVRWSTSLKADMIYAGPVIGADGTIYTTDYSGNLYAVASDGTLRWKHPSGVYAGFNCSMPAIDANGIIYYAVHSSTGDTSECLYAVNPDGSTKWDYKTELYGESSPAIGPDGTLYIVLANSLAAFGASGPLASSAWPMYQRDARHTGRATK